MWPAPIDPMSPGAKQVTRPLEAMRSSEGQSPLVSAADGPLPWDCNAEQLAARVAGDSDGHAGHVIGDIERVLGLICLHGAVGNGFRLLRLCLHVESTTVGGGCSGNFLQFLLNRIGGLGRRCRIGGQSRSGGLAAGGEARKREDQGESRVHHDVVIVNGASG